MRKRRKIISFVAGIIIFLSIAYAILNYYNSLYYPDEIKQLNIFFSQSSIDQTKTNGKVLGYSRNWPLFWERLIPIKRNGNYHIKSITFFDGHGKYWKLLQGTLQLEKLLYLNRINIAEQAIDSLILKECPNLNIIIGYNAELSFVRIDNCPNVIEIHLDENPIETLNITGCPALKELNVKECPLKELIVLETHPWQTWELDSNTVIVIKPDPTKPNDEKTAEE